MGVQFGDLVEPRKISLEELKGRVHRLRRA